MHDVVKAGIEKALSTEPKGRSKRSDLREALQTQRTGIEKVLKQGHSVTAVAKILKEAGVTASVETIRTHINDLLKQNQSAKTSIHLPKKKSKPVLKSSINKQQQDTKPINQPVNGFQELHPDDL